MRERSTNTGRLYSHQIMKKREERETQWQRGKNLTQEKAANCKRPRDSVTKKQINHRHKWIFVIFTLFFFSLRWSSLEASYPVWSDATERVLSLSGRKWQSARHFCLFICFVCLKLNKFKIIEARSKTIFVSKSKEKKKVKDNKCTERKCNFLRLISFYTCMSSSPVARFAKRK